MTGEFDPQAAYDPSLDVRDWSALERRFRFQSEGAFWPILGARRSGKTWALRALERRLSHAQYIDLRHGPPSRRSGAKTLLLDEAGTHIFHRPEPGQLRHEHRPNPATITDLLQWCTEQRENECVVVVALTPAEWVAVVDHEKDGYFVQRNELQAGALPALTADQARCLGNRTPGGAQIVAQVIRDAPDWARSPFLLTLLLEITCAEGAAGMLDSACQRALRQANDGNSFDYTERVFFEGLDSHQQGALRAVSRRALADPQRCQLLVHAGLLEVDDHGHRIADPVIAQHLPPPIRIHHVSDLHFGSKSAGRVDAKDDGPVGAALAEGAGVGPVRNDYRDWLSSLSPSHLPHLLVVSGDLAEFAKEEEFAEARQWLGEIESMLARHAELADGPRILLVGGNHDVDWTRAENVANPHDRHFPMAEALPDWPRPKLELAPTNPERSARIRYPNGGLEFALLGSAEYGGQVDPEIHIVVDEVVRRSAAEARKQLEQQAKAIGRRFGRADPGLIHTEDLVRLRQHSWVEPVRIAVLHHPLSPIPGTTEIAAYAGLVNAGQVKDALLDQCFCLALHGHVHKAWIGQECWPNRHGDRTLTIASAATLGSRETYETHGFNELSLFREGQERTLEIQPYEHRGQGFEKVGTPVTIKVPSRVGAA